mgnify:CR=1 FL=1
MKNASGAVKRKVNEIFGHTLRESEKKEICTLIYYPEEKLQLIKEQETDLDDWYLITLNQLVKVCQNVSSKYTRSKVRKALPAEFSYIIQELLHESSVEPNKHAYINVIISTITTVVLVRISSWIRFATTIISTFSGATMTYCGWAPHRAMTPA